MGATPALATLPNLDPAGKPAALRVTLPPNLAAAAARDAIAVRIDIEIEGRERFPAGTVPRSPALLVPPAHLSALFLLESWNDGRAAGFVQLNREQLGALIAVLSDEPVFFLANNPKQPLAWLNGTLAGVSEHLVAAPVAIPQSGTSRNAVRKSDTSRSAGSLRQKPRPADVGPPIVDGSEHYLAVQLPSREHPAYQQILDLLKQEGFRLETSNRKWWLRDRARTLGFLAAHWQRMEHDWGAEFTGNFKNNTARINRAEIDCDVSKVEDGFEVSLAVKAGPASEREINASLATGRGFVETAGELYLLDRTRLQQLHDTQRTLAGAPDAPMLGHSRHRVATSAIAETDEAIAALSPNLQIPDEWRRRTTLFRDRESLPPAPATETVDSLLRPYQRLGAAWLWHLRLNRLGGILADEMGLGKTLQALVVIAARSTRACSQRAPATPIRRGRNENGPDHDRRVRVGASLADARDREPGADKQRPYSKSPSSLGSDEAELKTSAANPASSRPPSPRHGETSRQLQDNVGPCLVVCPASLLENWRREAARFTPELRVLVHHGNDRSKESDELKQVDLVVTSYGTLARDQTLFHALTWDTLVADEAQHVKNRRTQNARALLGVRAEARLLLTGTPVENSLNDLESLFAVILPGYLKGIPTEARGEDRAWHEARLRRQAAPYILRRTKAQVTPELPPKIEQTVFVELTDEQRSLYEQMRINSESELMKLELAGRPEGSIRMAMFTQLLRLRQICGDPRLVDPARDPANSAKLAALMELLEEAADDGHRVLVFSQFTSLLALVRAELDARKTSYCYLDGAMPVRTRQQEVDRFNADDSVAVFLLSLKAGGTGLNLASADTVVHYDPWWNPAVETQATDRAHRIGQTRVVTSYKLIAAGTVEERVLALQNEKRALLANVFEEADAMNAALTIDDLKGLLTKM